MGIRRKCANASPLLPQPTPSHPYNHLSNPTPQGVLPYMGYTGMCHSTGYGFYLSKSGTGGYKSAFLSGTGLLFIIPTHLSWTSIAKLCLFSLEQGQVPRHSAAHPHLKLIPTTYNVSHVPIACAPAQGPEGCHSPSSGWPWCICEVQHWNWSVKYFLVYILIFLQAISSVVYQNQWHDFWITWRISKRHLK